MKILNIKMEDELFYDFKIRCAEEHKTMTQVITELIKSYTKEEQGNYFNADR